MRWRLRADTLRAQIEQCFWMPDAQYYGIAQDGAGELCRVRASNAGLLLYVGLPTDARALCVGRQLLSAPFNSGWGVRTLAEGEAHYNPMSLSQWIRVAARHGTVHGRPRPVRRA